MSIAAPPTNGQAPPLGPLVIERAASGPGPPEAPPPVAQRPGGRRGWAVGLVVGLLVAGGIGGVVISSNGGGGAGNSKSSAAPAVATNGFHNVNTLDAAMLAERNTLLSNAGSYLTATNYSCIATDASNTMFSCNSTFSDGSTGSTTATVNAAGTNWISANETIVP
jgi:hypothetical protein